MAVAPPRLAREMTRRRAKVLVVVVSARRVPRTKLRMRILRMEMMLTRTLEKKRSSSSVPRRPRLALRRSLSKLAKYKAYLQRYTLLCDLWMEETMGRWKSC